MPDGARLVIGAGRADDALVALLGPARAAALGRLLVERAWRWGEACFGADAVTTLHGAASLGEAIADAFEHRAAADQRPVVAVIPELAVWRPELAVAALDDLHAGCAVSFGPVFDGGFYLIAVARPLPALLEIPGADWAGRHAMSTVAAVAEREGLEVGLLRTERGLRRPADVRALLADPMTDGELRELLES